MIYLLLFHIQGCSVSTMKHHLELKFTPHLKRDISSLKLKRLFLIHGMLLLMLLSHFASRYVRIGSVDARQHCQQGPS